MRMKKMMNIKKEIEKIKCSPNQLKQRIAIFYKEYNEIKPKINEKIKIAKGDNLKRLIEFSEDVETSKKIIDDLSKPYLNKEKTWKNRFKKALLPFQIKKFHLLLRISYSMTQKYKKENCDINNFEV